ncbi:hypothetical protein MNB_SM-7-1121 [hydrothermal vent metagenome]|uniref:GGDEF domain-containing protein n=1 Tax=hydrothermal vent metagenome TaxID=652676 RepID=A0A1W1BAR7_9ZZZZ
MKNRLIQQIHENFITYLEKILEHTHEYEYRKRRYKVEYTIALYIAKESIDSEYIRKHVRDTDKLVVLDSNLVAMIFDFADEEAGFKAAENILSFIEPKLSNDEIYISVVNSKDAIDVDEHIRKALNLLMENIESGFRDIPEYPIF